MEDLTEKIKRLDEFCRNKNNYLRVLDLVGEKNKTYKRTKEKYGIPITRARFIFKNDFEEIAPLVLEEHMEYFKEFCAYVTIFPEAEIILNHNGTTSPSDNIYYPSFKKIKRGFQTKKSLDKEAEMYVTLARAKSIDFGEIKLPSNYLWENKGQHNFIPNCYSVNIGKSFNVNFRNKRISAGRLSIY